MKTTKQWLQEIKESNEKLTHWLSRQYIGEMLAAKRVKEFAENAPNKVAKALLTKVASDEAAHASWVGDLLSARNIPLPTVSYKEDRYWGPILESELSFEQTAGSGQLAEEMRLVRIRALADDPDIPEDIRKVFSLILPDEEFHAKAFAALTTDEALEFVEPLHKKGLNSLGLAA